MTAAHNTHGFVLVTTNGSIELADNSSGRFRRYWKQIAEYGSFVDPHGGSEPIKLDRPWADKIVENFKAGVRGFVPVPLGHPKTDSELAEKNRGELIDVEARDDGLYGLLEIRDPKTVEQIDTKQIPDVSVAFDDDYRDKKTGNWVGATLKHVGLVVNPYLKGMTQFEPVQMSDSASAAVLFSEGVQQINNSEERTVETIDVKNDRDFDVEVKYTNADGEQISAVKAGESITVPKDQEEAVKKQIVDAVAPATDDDEQLSDEQKKAKELAEREAAITVREAKLSEAQASAEFERLLSEGKIVPAQKDPFIALSAKGSATVELSDGAKKTVSVLLSELFKSAPKGRYLSEDGENDDDKNGGDTEVELSDEEKSLAKDFGNTPEEIAEFKKSQQVNN